MLIWVGGRIVPESALVVPAADRVFEHGLGLFETLRAWGGAVPLLPRHRARLLRSAEELGIPLDPATLPDAEAITRLVRENGGSSDVALRITATGGTSEGGLATVWVRQRPLPPPPPRNGVVVDVCPWAVTPDDPLARHKTLNYWFKRLAYEHGQAAGADEVLLATSDGSLWEGSRTNLFLVRKSTLITPGLAGPVLPGVMRGLVLEQAPGLGLAVREQVVGRADLAEADEVFLTNATRGVIPVGRLAAAARTLDAPGEWTLRLREQIAHWLDPQQQKQKGASS